MSQVILIPTSLGPLPVNADIIGPFAIHPTLHLFNRWTVTHLFSGLAVTYRAANADDAAQRVQRLLSTDFDWYALVPATWREYRQSGRRAVVALFGIEDPDIDPDTLVRRSS